MAIKVKDISVKWLTCEKCGNKLGQSGLSSRKKVLPDGSKKYYCQYCYESAEHMIYIPKKEEAQQSGGGIFQIFGGQDKEENK